MAGSDDIESVLHEGRMFPPGAEARHVRGMDAYLAMHQRALADPSAFWSEVARELRWTKPFTKGLGSPPPAVTWFEDGETKREREANLAQLAKAKSEIAVNLNATQALLAARTAGTAVPKIDGFTYNEFALKQTVEELTATAKQQETELALRVKQIAELNQVLNGELSLLLGSKTALHQSVMESVGALCTAILITLKETHPDYKEIDVAKIMSEFAVPDIS
jgi:hypothetical protein